ncbi:hypothetical protein SPRG_04311 [Saprolegnia parasitica CBS 223.65]|uniref:Uncharacterized protein n=1 Tax=Saprolegnia parasitica (strain CBS 223.65) TaxID=695850 RepID=A0A067CWN6_SAPPC|nr:hypothetical protein SPRG_04311 [Saprolegnia parasitica CBS 223.65]KDO31172.1 hypothetical protein SPRG_04311 [Saprolegnia parasitica CBS 223.65]|eukprot:XP_012198294.1 hypothetical protein SPRG_04311 [Saprolegnia parasitica CBS 223.65]
MPSYTVDACRPIFLTACDVPETDDDGGFDVHPPANDVTQRLALLALLQSPRRDEPPPNQHHVQVQARFSYIEHRYGTRPAQPKKTNKRTLARLANPILGHTSTLNALPPELRKKRAPLHAEYNDDPRVEQVKRPLLKATAKPKRLVKLPIHVKSTLSRDLKVVKPAPSCFGTQQLASNHVPKRKPTKQTVARAPAPKEERRNLKEPSRAAKGVKPDGSEKKPVRKPTVLPPLRPAGPPKKTSFRRV